jgi:hypothetical protein
MCHINSEDPSREGGVDNPKYYIENTNIYGQSTDNEIILIFPKKTFPLSPKNYADLEKSLRKHDIDLESTTKDIVGKCRWSYVLRKHGTKDKYVENVGMVHNWLGFIRPLTKGGGRSHMMLHYNMLQDRIKVEEVLESVLSAGLKLNL